VSVADDRRGARQLEVIMAEEIPAILEQNLDFPANGKNVDDCLRICIEHGCAPQRAGSSGSSELKQVTNSSVGSILRTQVWTA
jgi:hypothetical protein